MTSILKVTEIQDPTNSNSALTIDSSGRVSLPQIPCACVTLTTSNTQDGTTPYSTTGADILFDTVTVNQGSVYNSSNGRFTAPIAGIYEFSYSFLKDQDSSADYTYIDVYKNGSQYIAAGGRLYDENPTDYGNMSQSLLVSLAANDYLTLRMVDGGIYINANGIYSSVFFKFVG
tara:strand:+ start:429 stop:950 length:522 start_codon:yes stop_codon:yes gene_type:complete